MQKHYYEIAQGNTPGQLAALMKMVSISQVMFGSDYPFRDAKEAVDGLVGLQILRRRPAGDRQWQRAEDVSEHQDLT